MSQLLEELQEVFQDEESRYAYVEAHLNASVAAQIKNFRGEMSQEELAVKVGTKQSGISRLERATYSSWKVETLRKLARAFGLRLTIGFEEFGTLVREIENFKESVLHKRRFSADPVFNEGTQESAAPPESKPPQNETRLNIPAMPQPTQDELEQIQRGQNENLSVFELRGADPRPLRNPLGLGETRSGRLSNSR